MMGRGLDEAVKVRLASRVEDMVEVEVAVYGGGGASMTDMVMV